MSRKIRYRLTMTKTHFDRLGRTLIKVEARNGKRRKFFGTGVYVKPEQFDGIVVNHPHAESLNAYLVQRIMELERIEMNFFRVGISPSLDQLKEAYQTNANIVDFVPFATQVVEQSARKPATKENLLGTIKKVRKWRRDTTLRDIDYGWLKDFEIYLRGQGIQANTLNKALTNVRTLLSEALRRGYIDKDPFLMYQKPKTEQKEHVTLSDDEMQRIAAVNIHTNVRDAFLFCCKTGLRYSDYCNLDKAEWQRFGDKVWLVVHTIKTGVTVRLPMHLIDPDSTLPHPKIGVNSDTNRQLKDILKEAGITKRVTFHTARHTFATWMLNRGVDITCVQKMLGHTTVRQCQHYAETRDFKVELDVARAIRQA